MAATAKQLIHMLSQIPEDALVATGNWWMKSDAEDFMEMELTDEQWAKIAYYYDNNEQLGSDSMETLTDGIREITNS